MKFRLLCVIIILAGLGIYIYQFHQDKYNSAVSLVVQGTKSLKPYVVNGANALKEKVGLLTNDASHEESNITLDTPTASEASKEVLAGILNDLLDGTSASEVEELAVLPHTDQEMYHARRDEMCPIVNKIPWSKYGKNIKPVALGYFTKYDNKYKFTYCSVPKVASSNWKRTIIVLSYDEETRAHMTREDVNALKNVHNSPEVKALNSVGGSPLYPPYANYYKFVVFRHPFTRMVSAWRNKLQLVEGNVNKYFYKNYGIPMLKLTRGAGAERDFLKDQKQNLVTFPEFVEGIKHGIIDRHWMPQSELCQPCKVDYQFVGFFEYLNDDTNYILDQVGVRDDVVRANKVSDAGLKISTTVVTQQLFNALSSEDVDAMYKFYEMDFVMFGYEKDVNSPTFPFPAVSQVT